MPGLDLVFSIYLDLVRFVAAFAVVLYHSIELRLFNGSVPFNHFFGHEAVIAFFVLSGLVVASASARPNETWRSYFLARSSRIYSVTIAAIVLTYVLQGAAAYLTGLPGRTDLSAGILTTFSALIFLQQSWIYTDLAWNPPYWSLCYEVWYYIIFGFLFLTGGRRGIILAGFAGLIAGPAIILLLPVWWLGVWIFRHPNFSFGSAAGNIFCFAASLILLALLNILGIDAVVRDYLNRHIPSLWRVHYSMRFATDYLNGLLILANFVSFRALQHQFSRALTPVFTGIEKPVRWLAGYTFSIYLFHYPLLKFSARVFPNVDDTIIHYFSILAAIVGSCFLIGQFTEKKKWAFRQVIVFIDRQIRKSCRAVKRPVAVMAFWRA